MFPRLKLSWYQYLLYATQNYPLQTPPADIRHSVQYDIHPDKPLAYQNTKCDLI